ncbi:hypothetical protein LCGC14_2985790, partial [marine sediment metagenome]
PICAVEIEEYPRKVLLARQRDGILPWFPIWDDIKTFDGKPWRGEIDIVVGGFPCQDISCAGKGKGITGERSGLWGEMFRVVREVRPRFVFVENSPILTSRGLGVVLGDLAALGYDARWGVFSAGDVGARHKRERLWIIGDAVKNGDDWLEKNKSIRPEIKHYQSLKNWPPDALDLFPFMESSKPDSSDGINRDDTRVAEAVDRIETCGNIQVPQVAALAWKILSGIDYG